MQEPAKSMDSRLAWEPVRSLASLRWLERAPSTLLAHSGRRGSL